MNHQIKVTEQNGNYIGHALVDNNVVYITEPQANANAAAKLVTEYIQKTAFNANTSTKAIATGIEPVVAAPQTTEANPTLSSPPLFSPTRKCCGRG